MTVRCRAFIKSCSSLSIPDIPLSDGALPHAPLYWWQHAVIAVISIRRLNGVKWLAVCLHWLRETETNPHQNTRDLNPRHSGNKVLSQHFLQSADRTVAPFSFSYILLRSSPRFTPLSPSSTPSRHSLLFVFVSGSSIVPSSMMDYRRSWGGGRGAEPSHPPVL
jgi:hypothetical protein